MFINPKTKTFEEQIDFHLNHLDKLDPYGQADYLNGIHDEQTQIDTEVACDMPCFILNGKRVYPPNASELHDELSNYSLWTCYVHTSYNPKLALKHEINSIQFLNTDCYGNWYILEVEEDEISENLSFFEDLLEGLLEGRD